MGIFSTIGATSGGGGGGTTSFLLDDGNSAVPAAGVIAVTGGTGATTSIGAANQIHINTSNNVLTSQVVLTSAQFKALDVTPITIIPAPGVGKVIQVNQLLVKLTYGGSNAFTVGGNNVLTYGNPAGTAATNTINSTTLTNTQSGYANGSLIVIPNNTAATALENLAIVISATAANGGNAANDNTVTISATYRLLTM